ncbi:hydroxysqualene dehydroxylase HpnE [Rivibacter subsaxonicus]|uniref:Squalene-associated FAD-dependent desaturase n=1 Tax=Rivibacter subsaxonicus TaxID=457575 RepID=A0A4Q7VNY9_9BURK|nr:hydroxysqualene dehydroxylase HpnE [Rivibacter subsaxonicus]RZT98059.1 squalene-associated FAD-dependent desaturase [Rivibacter subsaxonicus]
MSAESGAASGARVAVVGAGWAGLAAAWRATTLGHAVTLYEMAPMAGGRARRLPTEASPLPGLALDNGQHILIGAYTATLGLLAELGVDERRAFNRRPLALVDARGHGLELPPGSAVPAFVRGVLAARGYSLRERLALLAAAGGWFMRGFRCDPRLTVAELTATLPTALRAGLIDPLCVAALNTPARLASAAVFLRVLRDALFAGPGAADLMLPRVDLGALLPDAASRALAARGAMLRSGQRVQAIERHASGWRVDGEDFDAVILAASSVESARLARPHAPDWSTTVEALRHEPIITVLVRAPQARLAQPMLALEDGPGQPAQFLFDLGRLRDPALEPAAQGVLAAVISGASDWVERGLDATALVVQSQLQSQLELAEPPTLLRTLCEKRATFLCTPGLARAPMLVAPGLWAAGDHVDGPYPATIEGAVRSGLAAAQAISR